MRRASCPSTVEDVGDKQRSKEPRTKGRAPMVHMGLAIVWGTGVGTVLFALTGDVLWVATGPSLGVLAAAVWQLSRTSRRDGLRRWSTTGAARPRQGALRVARRFVAVQSR